MKISISSADCVRCGACVAVCPSRIFKKKEGGIKISHVHSCILCGHCVAICHHGALTHSKFPAEKIHPIDSAAMPTPESVLLLCRARRSNRAFSGREVPQDMMDMILEAAHRAPTASNTQNVSFTVLRSKEHLDYVRRYTIDGYKSLYRKLTFPLLKPLVRCFAPKVYAMLPKFKRLLKEDKKGRDIVLRGATAVLLIHTPKDSRFGRDDANLAYQNASLMAESLGVSQFYGGFVCGVLRRDKKLQMERHFGIKGRIQAVMALGMPAFKFDSYIDKKDIDVQVL